MADELKPSGKVGLGAKLLKAHKELFEYAEHDTIIVSERDRKIFFDTIMNPLGPNEKLWDAAERYKISIQMNN